jgi:hypothetical protein
MSAALRFSVAYFTALLKLFLKTKGRKNTKPAPYSQIIF